MSLRKAHTFKREQDFQILADGLRKAVLPEGPVWVISRLSQFTNVTPGLGVPPQPVDATQALNLCRRFELQRLAWPFVQLCEVQVLTHGGGGGYMRLPKEASEYTVKGTLDYITAYGTKGPGEEEFSAFMRLMDQKDPSFRD